VIVKLLKKQPPKEASTEVSLADRIRQVHAEAEAYIHKLVAEVKNGRPEDGATLPEGILWRQFTKDHTCVCKSALALLEPKR
jgi:hypothetical protein